VSASVSRLFDTDHRLLAAYSEGAGVFRLLPEAVARPETIHELLALVREAGATGRALVPRGAGTGMAGGNVGRGVVVDLTRLDGGAVHVDARQRMAVTAAGTTFTALERAANREGLRLPPSPSSWRWATMGGMVGTNAAGAASFRHGSVRPWVQALTLVTADGERLVLERGRPAPEAAAVRRFRHDAEPALAAAAKVIRARWPRTRKNSCGYALDAWLDSGDLVDLVIGSEGTLGIVTAVRWRLDPIPAARGGLRLLVADDEALVTVLERLRSSEAVAVELLDRTFLQFVLERLPASEQPLAGRAGAMLLLEFEGTPEEVGASVAGWRQTLAPWAMDLREATDDGALARLWEIRHAASPLLARLSDGRRSLQLIEDGCVPPERLGEYLGALRRIAAAHGVTVVLFGHAGDGHVHANLVMDVTITGWEQTAAALFHEVSDVQIGLGGTPAGEHGAGRLRAGLLERLYGPEIVDLFRRVKSAFDPGGMMNPGVLVPSLTTAGAVPVPADALKVGSGAVVLPADIAVELRTIEARGEWDRDRFALAGRPRRD
jgi:FAD/FMN-containing dehydrogenase